MTSPITGNIGIAASKAVPNPNSATAQQGQGATTSQAAQATQKESAEKMKPGSKDKSRAIKKGRAEGAFRPQEKKRKAGRVPDGNSEEQEQYDSGDEAPSLDVTV